MYRCSKTTINKWMKLSSSPVSVCLCVCVFVFIKKGMRSWISFIKLLAVESPTALHFPQKHTLFILLNAFPPLPPPHKPPPPPSHNNRHEESEQKTERQRTTPPPPPPCTPPPTHAYAEEHIQANICSFRFAREIIVQIDCVLFWQHFVQPDTFEML